MLISVLWKMRFSGQDQPTLLLDRFRKFAFVEENAYNWRALPLKLTSFSYEMPLPHSKSFYLVCSYHGGRDGKVWLAASSSGRLVVIKFVASAEGAAMEADRWIKVWKVKARSCTLVGAPAVLVPFVFHGKIHRSEEVGDYLAFTPPNSWTNMPLDTDCDKLLGDGTIKENGSFDRSQLQRFISDPVNAATIAIMDMAKQGFVHGDISWRHVGLLPQKQPAGMWNVKPALIDLTDVRSGTSQDMRNQIREDALEQIQKLRQEFELFANSGLHPPSSSAAGYVSSAGLAVSSSGNPPAAFAPAEPRSRTKRAAANAPQRKGSRKKVAGATSSPF
jgi:hypothetical protein